MDSIWKDMSCNLKQSSKATLVITENAGRGLIATEDIQRGDMILQESPLIIGPSQSVGAHFCVNCSQPLTAGILQGKHIIFHLLVVFFIKVYHTMQVDLEFQSV